MLQAKPVPMPRCPTWTAVGLNTGLPNEKQVTQYLWYRCVPCRYARIYTAGTQKQGRRNTLHSFSFITTSLARKAHTCSRTTYSAYRLLAYERDNGMLMTRFLQRVLLV